jgi:hypothetical protein
VASAARQAGSLVLNAAAIGFATTKINIRRFPTLEIAAFETIDASLFAGFILSRNTSALGNSAFNAEAISRPKCTFTMERMSTTLRRSQIHQNSKPLSAPIAALEFPSPKTRTPAPPVSIIVNVAALLLFSLE